MYVMRLFWLVLFLNVGCIKPYSFPFLLAELPAPKECVYLEEKIKIDAQYFSQQGCKKYFGLDLVKKGYRPLLIKIVNLSQDSYTFKQETITVPSASCNFIIESLSASYKAPSLLVGSRLITMGQLSFVGSMTFALRYLYNTILIATLEHHTLAGNVEYYLHPGSYKLFVLFVHEKLCTNRFNFSYINIRTEQVESVEVDLFGDVDSCKFIKPSWLILK